MPKLTDTMEDGVLSAWLVDEGDPVSAGDVIAQVETDKATMDVEVFDDGTLLKKMIEEGDSVPIGQLIAVMGEEGEDISGLVGDDGSGDDGLGDDGLGDDATAEEGTSAASSDEADSPSAGTTETPTETPPETPTEPAGDGQIREREPEPVPAGTDSEGRRIKASPLARRMAQEHDVDLSALSGSGPEGRIVRRDIEARIEEQEAEPVETAPEPEETPTPATTREPAYEMPSGVIDGTDELYESENISQMRKTISRRLAQSKYTAPHFYLTVDVDMSNAIDARKKLNELTDAQDRPKISFNDFITKSCALALREHPYVNASYLADDGEIRKYNAVHIGVAVAIDEGLITPVIRNADRKGLAQISKETRELATRARNRQLQPDEFEGSTFTTSNLGMFGIEEFTAIINPPNAAILAIGEIRDVPMVEDGEVVPGKRMKITLSCDHRVVDGAVGAKFLQTVQRYLEDPMNMLL